MNQPDKGNSHTHDGNLQSTITDEEEEVGADTFANGEKKNVMKTFVVSFDRETSQQVEVTVEAENEDSATEKAWGLIEQEENGDIDLNWAESTT